MATKQLNWTRSRPKNSSRAKLTLQHQLRFCKTEETLLKLIFLTTVTTKKHNFTSLLKTTNSSLKLFKKKEETLSRIKRVKTKITRRDSSLKTTPPSLSTALLKATPTWVWSKKKMCELTTRTSKTTSNELTARRLKIPSDRTPSHST